MVALILAAVLATLVVSGLVVASLWRRGHAQVGAAGEAAPRFEDLRARAQRAALGSATVVSCRTAHMAPERGAALVRLRLQVESPGMASYSATTTWEVEMGSLSLVQSGQSIAVKIDLEDSAIIFPNMGGARFWPHPV